jgi:hypothetical protein
MDHRDDAADAFGLLPVPQSKIRFSETLREQNEQRLTSDAWPSATSSRRPSRGKIILVLVVALVATIVSAPVSYALWYFHY